MLVCRQSELEPTGFEFGIGVGPFNIVLCRGLMPGGRQGWFVSFSVVFKRNVYWFGYYSYLQYCEQKFRRCFGSYASGDSTSTLKGCRFGNFSMTRLRCGGTLDKHDTLFQRLAEHDRQSSDTDGERKEAR
jgi:hypothetical protein